MTQLMLGGLGGIVLAPDVLEEQRGAWCSPPEWCERATERGPFDVDPFTNPRSTLRARHKCMLERGDDGFGLDKRDTPGTYYIKGDGIARASCTKCYGGGRVLGQDLEPTECTACSDDAGYHVATEQTRMWFQPPYDIVLEALAHYGHTRFVALLRLDTSTEWFDQMFAICEVIMVPRGERVEFVPPPGVKASTNPFPHGLYYRRAADVPDAVREHCYAWPCPSYPWDTDPLQLRPTRALWRMFEHAADKGRPTYAVHLARVDGVGTEDHPLCGDPHPRIVSVTHIDGLVLACTQCMKISELATVTPLR